MSQLVHKPRTTALSTKVKQQYEAIDAAIAQLIASRRTQNTKDAYRRDWRKWRDFVDAHDVNLAVPDLPHTIQFRDELTAKNEPKTVVRILATLSFFYQALRDAGIKGMHLNPFNRAWLPRPDTTGDTHRTVPVDDEHVAALEASIRAKNDRRSSRDAAIVRLLYDTGLRRASVASLKRADLRMEQGTMIATVIVKGGKTRSVALTSECADAITAWLKVAPTSRWVFPARAAGAGRRVRKDEYVRLATINDVIARRARQARLPHMHPHQFRAAFITSAYDAHLYERDIQTAAHHASAQTTRGYDRGNRGDGVFGQVSEFRKNGRKKGT